MTLGAIIGTQLTDHAARAYRLNIGPLDVIKPYSASWATSYGVILESIVVSEEGAGGVSSMTFTVDDPKIELTMEVGQEVEFWDLGHQTATILSDYGAVGQPLFRGFLQSLSIRPDGVNRYIDVTCIGVEAVLDWMVVPTYTIPSGTGQAAAVQSLVYNATGIGFPLRAFSMPTFPSSPSDVGDLATPVASDALGLNLRFDVVVADGSSLRQAISDVFAACDTGTPGTGFMSGAFATVDFYGGLRTIEAYVSVNDPLVPVGVVGVIAPRDYYDSVTATSTNTPVGSNQTTDLEFNIDVAGAVRGVYIRGANAAGSGLVSDGSGIAGPISYLSDDTSTTAAIRNAIAVDYLSRFALSIRGSFTYETVPAAILAGCPRPGGYWSFGADSQTFVSTTALPIASIRKTFLGGGEQAWTVAVGGFPPSAVKQMRRLTRDVRS